MTSLYNNTFTEYYNFIFTELADKRTNNWFLISDPIPTLTILLAYHYFVYGWGPKYMKHRNPFELKNLLVVYNFIQVLVSVYIVYEALAAGWLTKYSWKCQPVDFSESEEAIRVARMCYIYYLAKISELLDTVFFVLRKKEKQMSFLHMYHHTSMPLASWAMIKYYPGGHGTFMWLINSFIHIIMYSYYMIAAMGPKYQKYIWWKKHMTSLQLIQFCVGTYHQSQLMFYDCEYPRLTLLLTLPNGVIFLYMFSNFYNKSYKSAMHSKDRPNKENILADDHKHDSKNKNKQS